MHAADDRVRGRRRAPEPAHPRRRRAGRRSRRIARSRRPAEHRPRRSGRAGQQRRRQGARPRRRSPLLPHVDGARRARQLHRRRRRSSPASRRSSRPRSARPGPMVGGAPDLARHHRGPLPPARAPEQRPAADDAARRRAGVRRRRSRASIAWPTTFYAGGTNFTDWYYPSSGLGVTSVAGVCTTRHLHGRQRRRGVHDRRPVLAVDQPRLDGALGRPRPARHREPDAGGERSTSR